MRGRASLWILEAEAPWGMRNPPPDPGGNAPPPCPGGSVHPHPGGCHGAGLKPGTRMSCDVQSCQETPAAGLLRAPSSGKAPRGRVQSLRRRGEKSGVREAQASRGHCLRTGGFREASAGPSIPQAGCWPLTDHYSLPHRLVRLRFLPERMYFEENTYLECGFPQAQLGPSTCSPTGPPAPHACRPCWEAGRGAPGGALSCEVQGPRAGSAVGWVLHSGVVVRHLPQGLPCGPRSRAPR